MTKSNRFNRAVRGGLLGFLALCSPGLYADLWISPTPATGKPMETASSADKLLYIQHGAYPDSVTRQYPPGTISESEAFLVDPNDERQPAQIEGNLIRFRAPLKGQHWVYLQERRLNGDTLEIETSKYRFYNRKGDVKESVLKEIRGRTNDSKYDRPPVAGMPLEIVLLKPEQDHHISCCLYSGDRVRLKLYLDQQALTRTAASIRSESGWQARFDTDNNGVMKFEIPRYRYSASSERRNKKQYLLITAEHRVESAGSFQGQPYRQIHYRTNHPIDFRPSPLEWAAKLPAFLLLGGILLITGFGVFLYRLKIRRRRLVCD
jgi:hypothetical protein